MPGNPLYVLKVNLNEPVRALTGITPEKRIEYDVEFAMRRLDEAEQRAAVGALDAVTSAMLERRFKASSGKARKAIDGMMQTNAVRAAELNMILAAGLTAHASVIGAMMDEKAGWRAQLQGIEYAVKHVLGAAGPGDLFKVGKNATVQQLASIARRISARKSGIQAKVSEASRKTGVSGVVNDSIEEWLVGEAEAFLSASAEHYATAQLEMDSNTNDKVYVTLLTSLSATVQADVHARAALRVHDDSVAGATARARAQGSGAAGVLW